MKTNLTPKTDLTEASAIDKPLQIILTSDHPTAGAAARKLIDGFVEKWAPDVESHRDDWNFAELDHPAFRREALEMARCCDVLVVALAGSADVPASFRDWLCEWSQARSSDEAALILCAPPALCDRPIFSSIPSLLSGHGLTCFSTTIALPGTNLPAGIHPKTWLARLAEIDARNLPEISILND